MNDKFIDVERIIADKKPGLAKSLPRFVVRYFKRILHQREINDIIRENHNLKNEAFCKIIVYYIYKKYFVSYFVFLTEKTRFLNIFSLVYSFIRCIYSV